MRMPDNCTVRLADLPYDVGGFVSESPDGHLNIYLNARLSSLKNKRSARHELKHIAEDDLHSARTIYAVEGASERSIDVCASIPGVMRAVDLLPPPPKPDPDPLRPDVPPLTAWQRRVLHECMASLDAALARATAVPLWPDA